MTVPHRLLAVSRAVLAATAAVVLSACALWPGEDAPPRTSISLSVPSSMNRPEWLQQLVAEMDAKAFPHPDGLALKLSYELSRSAPKLARSSGPASQLRPGRKSGSS
jgi:hypothetical protein